MSARDGWSRETAELERELERRAGWKTTALQVARSMLETTADPARRGQLEQIIAVLSVVHLGESEDRCSNLCSEQSAHDYSNIDLDRVTGTDDGSWIDEVTCVDCLRLAVKIGDDARRRLALGEETADEGGWVGGHGDDDS